MMKLIKRIFTLALAAAFLCVSAGAEELTVTEVSSGHRPAPDDSAVSNDAVSDDLDTGTVYPFVNTGIISYRSFTNVPEYVSFIFCVSVSNMGFDPTAEEQPDIFPIPNMTWKVGIVNDTPDREQEMTDFIYEQYPYNNNISFEECSLTYDERDALRLELRDEAERLSDKMYCDTVLCDEESEKINVNLAFFADENGNAPYDEEEFQRVKDGLISKFGDIAVVNFVDHDGQIPVDQQPESGESGRYEPESAPETRPLITETEETRPLLSVTDKTDNNRIDPYLICAVAALALAAGIILFAVLKKKSVPILSTADGREVTAVKSGPKQVEEAVKNAEVTPDDRLYEEIVKKIENS